MLIIEAEVCVIYLYLYLFIYIFYYLFVFLSERVFMGDMCFQYTTKLRHNKWM
jgi:hypothetical protein